MAVRPSLNREPTPRKIPGSVTKSERTPAGGGWDLYEDGAAPEVFADGVLQAMIGPAVTRLLLYRSEGVFNSKGAHITPSSIEQRRLIESIVMPTSALIGLCAFITQQLQQGTPQLNAALDEQKTLFSSLSLGESQTPVIPNLGLQNA